MLNSGPVSAFATLRIYLVRNARAKSNSVPAFLASGTGPMIRLIIIGLLPPKRGAKGNADLASMYAFAT